MPRSAALRPVRLSYLPTRHLGLRLESPDGLPGHEGKPLELPRLAKSRQSGDQTRNRHATIGRRSALDAGFAGNAQRITQPASDLSGLPSWRGSPATGSQSLRAVCSGQGLTLARWGGGSRGNRWRAIQGQGTTGRHTRPRPVSLSLVEIAKTRIRCDFPIALSSI